MKNTKVIFMGTPDFSVPVFKMLIEETDVVLAVTQPDKPVGRHHELKPTPIKEVALENNIPVFQPKKIKEEYEKILNTPCDIIITCAYGQIIPEEILNYPKLGCVNVHASLLPKYRGGAPIHWCLLNGEEKTGVTIMYMDKGMDTGDMISKKEYVIKNTDNVGILHEELSKIGAELLKETLPSIIAGTNERIKQNNDEATYAYNITRKEERIDFSRTGHEIQNQIRGLNPWPTANFLVNNEEFKALEATFEKKENTTPGTVREITKDAIGIDCIDGVIYLTKIKPFGKKIMNVKDYLNGVKKETILNWVINE